jgi:ribosomal protein S18 acetylase RimI-like enzyme
METHVLDNPIWHALQSVHAEFAQGDGLAKRYPGEVSPLAAVKEPSPEAYHSLGKVLDEDDAAVLFLADPPQPPQGWDVVHSLVMEQRVCTAPPEMIPHEYTLEPLTTDDVKEMRALAELTEPGPFRQRTIEFGGYLGICDGSRLVAMAGQRLSLAGFTEVSAVCTHPDYRGRGYANVLVTMIARAIFARGETPFLGVRQDNTGAIRVYEKLGFKVRRTLHVVVLKRPERNI